MELPSLNLIPHPIPDGGDDTSLDIMSKMVLGCVDGESSIENIAGQIGLDSEMAAKIVKGLLERGIVSVPGSNVGTPETEKQEQKSPLLEAVEAAYGAMEFGILYDILGVEPDAPRVDIRTAYFALSKKFHPDKAYKENTPGLRPKMEVVFRRYTDAYDVLSKSISRREYDETISEELALRAMEKKLKKALSKDTKPPRATEEVEGIPAPDKRALGEKKESSKPPRAQPVISSFPSKPPPPIKKSSSPSMRSSDPPKPSSPSSRSSSEPPNRPSQGARTSNPNHEERRKKWQRERAGRAMAAILNRSSASPPPLSSVARLIDTARSAVEHERHAEAVRILEGVLKVDPENQLAKNLMESASAAAAVTAAKELLSLGLHQSRQGNIAEAKRHFQTAMQTDPGNLDARHLFADTLLRQHEDLSTALNLVKEVIGMGGKRARYYVTLGELLLLANENERAVDAFERACTMAPDNKEYKKRLKACKR